MGKVRRLRRKDYDVVIIGATREQIQAALETAGARFDDNLCWNREPEYMGKTRDKRAKYRCTLRVKDSHGKEARLGHPDYQTGKQRHMISACWHAHGTFYDALPEGTEIKVSTADGNRTIRPGDRWHDFNIGSVYRPMYYSEACECW